MNTSFTAAERMRILPRLRILQHATRLLCEQIPQMPHTAISEVCSQHALDWDSWERFPVTQPEWRIESMLPLQLPAQAGICARLLGSPVSGLLPQTPYLLPHITLSLLEPNGEKSLEFEIIPGPFQTFAQGNPTRQLLEYLATVLDMELLPLGFRCLRQGSQLSLEALPERAGWNLSIAHIMPPAESGPYTEAGLHTGMSSLAPDQQRGLAANLHWGPYLINGQSCVVSLPFESDTELFGSRFLKQLQAQLEQINCHAAWSPQGKLILTPTVSELEIQALAYSDPAPPDLRLELPLPTGLHRPLKHATRHLGELVINEVPITLEAPADLPVEVRADWLCKRLNQTTAGIEAQFVANGTLCLRSLAAGPAPVITQISPALGHWLGLTGTSVPQQASWQALWTRWTQLRTQLLETLPPHALPQLRQQPTLAPTEATDQSSRVHWLQTCQEELQTFQTHLEGPAPSEKQESVPTMPQALPTLSVAPLTRKENPGPSENEPPSSRFDHKI
ncbi:MAG: hypothetical protein ACO1RX_09675 [Candidatus Sericytochromatia bacterium]